MKISKNDSIEKDDNYKDKLYEKTKIWSFQFSENWGKYNAEHVSHIKLLRPFIFSQLWLNIIKFYVWPYFSPDIFESYDTSVIELLYIISHWGIGDVTYGLRSLSYWGLAIGSDQTFVQEILISYFWLFFG